MTTSLYRTQGRQRTRRRRTSLRPTGRAGLAAPGCSTALCYWFAKMFGSVKNAPKLLIDGVSKKMVSSTLFWTS